MMRFQKKIVTINILTVPIRKIYQTISKKYGAEAPFLRPKCFYSNPLRPDKKSRSSLSEKIFIFSVRQ